MTLSNTKILVVEDERDIRELITLHLKREGLTIDEASTGEEAFQKLNSNTYSLLVLDWMLPGLNGLEITSTLRQRGLTLPILMVTAKAEPADIVQGLEGGVDDYLVKPFDVPVLLARVRALLRRTQLLTSPVQGARSSEILEISGLKMDFARYEVFCHNDPIKLTPSEFKLLGAMFKNQGRVLTRDQLILEVQGEGISVVGRAIDTHVFGLRKKLGDCSDVVETIRGVGYRVKSSDSA